MFKLLSMQLNKLRKLKNSILEQNVLIAANLLKNVKNLVFICNEVKIDKFRRDEFEKLPFINFLFRLLFWWRILF